MQADPALVLFCGGMGGSAVEDALGDALRECALDTLDEARSTGAELDRIVITGPRREYLLTSRREGETIAAADPFYAVALTSKPPP